MKRLLIFAGLALIGLLAGSIAARLQHCSTALERSYLNEGWRYTCPIDPLR